MVSSLLEEYQGLLSKEIDSFLPQGPLFDLIRYHLKGGKRIRPILCLSACQALGGEKEMALPVACAIELLHNFTLIHDDIEDGSEIRRGRPALWKICGQAQAINAADALFALSHLCLLKAAERGVSWEKVYLLDKLFNSTCLKICSGQHQDLSMEKKTQITQEEYLSMASEKTGALFEFSILSGALLLDPEEKTLNSLKRCGNFLGLGFQIQDDILCLQDEGETFAEIKRRKKTFPLIYVLEKEPEASKIYQKEKLDTEDISSLLALLRKSNALEYSLKVAKDFYQKALEALKEACLPQPDELERVVLILARRGIERRGDEKDHRF